MSTYPESSDRPVTTSSTDLVNLGAQLSEVLNRFNELNMEMTAQRRVIDQLVTGSSGGIQREPLPANPTEPILLPCTQTSFTPHFANPHKETFTYFTHDLPHTHAPTTQANPPHLQIPQNHPSVNLNRPLESQKPYYNFTAEPFTLDTAIQWKVEAGGSSAPIDKNLLKRLDRFDEFMRKSQGLIKQESLDYNELCLFPDMQLPVGFKAPKFSKYDGTGNPKTHLRMFANKLGKPMDDENLPVRLFPESLEDDALDWYSNLKPEDMRTWLDLSTVFIRQYEYNCDLAPTRTTLEGTKRKPSEDHKTYAKIWRKLAAKVEPSMTEDEIVRTFIKAHDPPYFEEIFRMTGCSFAEIVNKLEEYDEFVRAGKIVNVSALKSQLEAMQNQGDSSKKSQFEKKEEETSFVWNQNPSFRPRYRQYPTYPSHYSHQSHPRPVYRTTINHHRSRPNYPNTPTTPFHISPPNFQTRPRPPYNPRPVPPNKQNYNHPQTHEIQNPGRSRVFTNLVRPIDQLYEQLKAAGKIGMIPPPTYPYGMPAWYNPQAVCAYHSGAPGHSTLDCKALKHKVQDMIESGEIVIRKRETQGPNVNRNPLPEHVNTIGVILDDTEYVEQVKEMAREAEVFGITDQPFVIELPSEEDKKPFILDLTPTESEALEPVFIEFPKQEPVLSLQQVPWNYDEPVIQIGEKSIAKKEVSVVTRSGKTASPFETAIPIPANNSEPPVKPTITEREALDFLKRLQRSEYNVVEKLSKSPAQISMLDLLFSSDRHRDALIELLTKAQIPKDISVDNFSHVVGNVLFTKQITFSDEELPAEGIGHNKALYIVVRCNGKMLPKVLIDNGSALNICPWNTLEKLGLQDV
ncbi:uncharacterized protein LOC113751963 [Coffea eugenioides]|uniref:uncharacterized protein LOC113751963 n=1 Tax=Coffea eugenioides TaxID=49369 RepID=UPI000F614383|nr:uncharacterized protein LOC113751963 [Coffea eugenioides]